MTRQEISDFIINSPIPVYRPDYILSHKITLKNNIQLVGYFADDNEQIYSKENKWVFVKHGQNVQFKKKEIDLEPINGDDIIHLEMDEVYLKH